MAYPLTTVGVNDLIQYLYALPNNKLEIEALAVKNDFKTWVATNFILSRDQVNYLNALTQNSIQYFGDQCWFCFIHRLSVTLDYPAAPTQTRVGKWTGGQSSTKLITNDSGNEEASGAFSFSMIFREI